MRQRIVAAALAAIGLSIGLASPAGAQEKLRPHRGGELLVRFDASVGDGAARGRLQGAGARLRKRLRFDRDPGAAVNRFYHVDLPAGLDMGAAIERFERLPGVDAVQPNYIHTKNGAPNDPSFGSLWGLHNTAQAGNRGPLAPVAGADIDWLEAWDLIDQRTPPQSTVVVAVIDTGVNYNHPDLAPIMWTNPNGAADGLRGWDYANNDSDPVDDDGHGSHCSGTIAGSGDDGVGVVGVARRNVRIMAMKFLGATGSGATSDAIECINYAVAHGAMVLSNSWSGGPFEQALYDAIAAANAAGVVFVAAAGNGYSDNDVTAVYPASYDLPNVLSIAASTRQERLAEFSNWGRTTVDLAAPGEEILSTILGTGYAFYNGTSMATPHVAGALGVLYSLGLATTPAQAIALVMDSTDPSPAYAGRTVSEGRLNLLNIVERGLGADTTPPGAVSDLRLAVAAPDAVTLRFTATGDDGSAGRAMRYDLRYGPATGFVYETATRVRGGHAPAPAGTTEQIAASGLAAGTAYTFQLRVLDNGGNATFSNAVTVQTAPADPVVFADDMEAGAGQWNSTSAKTPTWTRTSATHASGAWCWTDSATGSYPNGQSASLASPVFSLADAGDATLTFWQRYDLESGFDFARVEVSINGGTSWTTLLTQSGTNTTWHPVTVKLTSVATQPSVRIRFRLTSDTSIVKDGWYVDDVVVTKAAPLVNIVNESCNTPTPWVRQSAWGIEGGNYLADSPGAVYGDNLLAMARLVDPIDLSLASRAVLSFDISYDFEVYSGAPVDALFLEMSTDGERWFPLKRYSGTRAMARDTYDLARFAGAGQVWLRFVLATDIDVGKAGALIDNLRVDITPYTPPNGAPNATDDAYAATEDSPLAIPAALGVLENDTDPDDDALTATIVSAPAHGAASVGSDGAFTYTPAADYAGPDAFTYRAADPLGAGDTATVTITVSNTPDAPVAQPASATTAEDTDATGTLFASDADGDGLTYEVVDAPAHGTLALNGAGFTYTPAADYNGADGFTFLARDASAASNVAAVGITVNPANDAPTAQDGTAGTAEDTPVTAPLVGADIDGDALSFEVATGPAHGSVSIVGASFTYTPAADYAGPDAFTFRALDGSSASAPGSVALAVDAVNDAPVAADAALVTTREVAASGTLGASDVDGPGPFTFAVTAGPAHGALALDGAGYTYTPEAGYTGPDEFTFTANDGLADSAAARVSITVNRVNVAPVADDGTLAATEDAPAAGQLTATDADGDALTYSIVEGPTHGTLTSFDAATGAYTYQPAPNYAGPDAFTFQAFDGIASSGAATVSIDVAATPDVPVALDGSASTLEDTAATGMLAGTDADGDALTFEVVAGPASGSLELAGASFTYTPAANWSGSDSFTFRAFDGAAYSAPATIALAVTSVNDGPTAQNDAAATNGGVPAVVTVLANDSDPDGGTLSVTSVGSAAKGTVVKNANNTITYTPDAGTSGVDSFTYTMSDGQGGSATATVTITVVAVVQTIASDGFESGNWTGGTGWAGGWTATGDASVITGSTPHGGTRQARLRRGTGYAKRVVNLSGVTSARLKVWIKGTSFEGSENATVRVSSNGSTFTTVATLAAAQANGAWMLVDVDLSGFAMTSTFTVAFDANMGQNDDQFYVDDVTVEGIR